VLQAWRQCWQRFIVADFASTICPSLVLSVQFCLCKLHWYYTCKSSENKSWLHSLVLLLLTASNCSDLVVEYRTCHWQTDCRFDFHDKQPWDLERVAQANCVWVWVKLLCHVYRYCNQVLDKEIDDCCTELLQDLVRFQEQTFNKDPSKVCCMKNKVSFHYYLCILQSS